MEGKSKYTNRPNFFHFFSNLRRKGLVRLANLDCETGSKTKHIRDPRDLIDYEVKTKNGWWPIRQ